MPEESAKHGGLWSIGEWAAKAGVDKNISGYVSGAALNTGAYVITYTVPAGRVLYVSQFSAIAYLGANQTASIGMRATLEVPGAIVVCSIGGENGAAYPLVKPMKATAAQTVRLFVEGFSASTGVKYGTINGYEVDA